MSRPITHARRYVRLAPGERHEPEGDDWPGFRPETDAELYARVDRAAAEDRRPGMDEADEWVAW